MVMFTAHLSPCPTVWPGARCFISLCLNFLRKMGHMLVPASQYGCGDYPLIHIRQVKPQSVSLLIINNSFPYLELFHYSSLQNPSIRLRNCKLQDLLNQWSLAISEIKSSLKGTWKDIINWGSLGDFTIPGLAECMMVFGNTWGSQAAGVTSAAVPRV